MIRLLLDVLTKTGLQGGFSYLFRERLDFVSSYLTPNRGATLVVRTYGIRVPYLPRPALCRIGTSDRWAFAQVFIKEQYRLPGPLPKPRLILDCGANVGYTSLYLLARFREAHLVAVEPDEANYRMLCLNLAPFADRARPVRAAVWPKAATLEVCQAPPGTRGEWASWVRECAEEVHQAVHAMQVDTLIDESGFDRADIIRLDIEGAEEGLLLPGSDSWIDRTDTIMVELHGQRASDLFRHATDGRGFSVYKQGEVTIATRKPPAGA